MKALAVLIAVVVISCLGTTQGQIHADFTISSGGTQLGTFRARLDYDRAPRTCANFIGLATGNRPWIDVATGTTKANKPFYNGLIFHRLIHNFMIQGGSPNGQGTDGPGFVIQDEYHESLRHSGRYMLSMAKSTYPNTGGSQFFITLQSAAHLDDKHSVFGEVISGREIIDGFTNAINFPTDASDRPLSPIIMETVVISGPDLPGFNLNNPALKLPHIVAIRINPSRNSSENSFTLSFDRRAQHNYVNSYSHDLTTWIPFRQILSSNAEIQWPFQITGVTFDRFFSRLIDIDYSLLPNPPGPLMPAGASLTFSDRIGKSLTLVSNGSGGGAWSDSSGASGTINSLATYDGVGTSGVLIDQSSKAHFIPLAQLIATLDAPTGINNRDHFDLILSFHSPTDGWTEGSASGGINPNSSAILHHFTYSP